MVAISGRVVEIVVVEIVVEIEVKATVEPRYYTILYNKPLQRQSRGPQCSILCGSTILFTGVSYSPISTVLSYRPDLREGDYMLSMARGLLEMRNV